MADNSTNAPESDVSIDPHNTEKAEIIPVEIPSDFQGRFKALFGLALPIIGGMISQNLLNLVDIAMVGRLDNTEIALGAVGFGGIISWLCSAFFMGAGPGVQAITSRAFGAGLTEDARNALNTSLILVAVLVIPYSQGLSFVSEDILSILSTDENVVEMGVPYLDVRLMAIPFVIANFCFRGYWNGVGKTGLYLRTIIIMHLANIFLNWVLIYGNLGAPELGVLGAGCASAISVALGTTMYIGLAFLHEPSGKPFTWPSGLRKMVKRILRLSIPNGTQNILFSLGFSVFYAIAQRLGTAELAATNVLINLNLACVLPGLGFGLASATLVGQSLGRKRPKDAEQWAWLTVKVSAACLTALGLCIAYNAEFFLSLLVHDADTVALAIVPLVILGMIQPADSVGVVLSQTLLGAGAVKTVMGVSIALQWGLFLPLAYWLCVVENGDLVLLWMLFAGWRVLFSGAMVWTFQRGKWKDTHV